MKAVCEATGRSLQQIKTDATALGDLGDVAQASRGKQRTLGFMKAPPRLTVPKVFGELTAIAHMSGDKVQQRKVGAIKGLLVACQNSEAKYIIRALGAAVRWLGRTRFCLRVTLGGKLRINLAEQTVLSAIAAAFVQTPPSKGVEVGVLGFFKMS